MMLRQTVLKFGLMTVQLLMLVYHFISQDPAVVEHGRLTITAFNAGWAMPAHTFL